MWIAVSMVSIASQKPWFLLHLIQWPRKHALFMAEFVAEAISKCTIHKTAAFFWICDMRIGYARVSTDDQTLDLQRGALKRAKCRQIYEEHASGKTAIRPELEACLKSLRKGDTLVVWRLDRLGRSLRACLKSRMRGHVIVGVMTISTDVDKLYDTDLTDAAWALIAPMLPAARRGGRPRKINIRAVLNAIFYLLRTGCQWRLLPREFPGWSTVYHYFQAWKNAGVWTCIQRSMYQQARRQAGRATCPSVVIMDGQSVKTTERGGIRGFDAHKRVKGRKRHILVDTFGLLIACRVEPADISDRKAAALLLGGLRPLFQAPMPDTKVVSLRVTCCARTAGSSRSSNAGSARSGLLASPGLWNAASPGLAAIGDRARITSTACRALRHSSKSPQHALCSIASLRHETF